MINKENKQLQFENAIANTNAAAEEPKEKKSSAKRQKKVAVLFTDFMQEELDGCSLGISTRKNHISTINLLRTFRPDTKIADVNFKFLCDFDFFLTSRGYGYNTVAKHMKHIKRYINMAINLELFRIDKYPFRRYKIGYKVTKRAFMTPEELQRFENLKLPTSKALRRSHDMFLFCCYTGMRFSDVIRLTNDNFILIGGRLWLIYTTVKTKTEIHIPLDLVFDGKAAQLHKKYKRATGLLFNTSNQSNSNINKQLLKLAEMAEITKRISFHSSRHTNATLLLYDGTNITTVQKLLGHHSVQTTEIYSKILDMTIVRDLESTIAKKKKRKALTAR
ncbi:MAG: site-specific integrase [Tannerellaceae bacterium]|jgi:integrase|nr:site-specific integrase [Tannerellaceae bacterium]